MSKTERLLEAIGEIDEKYVAESDKFTKNSNKAWLGITAAAACALVVAGVGVRFLNSGGTDLPYADTTAGSEPAGPTANATTAVTDDRKPAETITTDPNLPILAYPDEFSQGGMGFEGYTAYDVSELKTGNPWTEDDEISMLPVYKNMRFFDDEGNVPRADFDSMKAILIEKATALGYTVSDGDITTISDESPYEENLEKIKGYYMEYKETSLIQYFSSDRVSYTAPDGSLTIEVDSWLDITIKIPPLEGVYYDYDMPYSDYKNVAKAFEAFIDEHPGLLGFENPEVVVIGGDRDKYGSQSFDIGIYEREGGIETQICNYDLSECRVGLTDEIWYIRINGAGKSDIIGDYPIITSAEAKELLLDGNYGSSYVKFFGEASIAKVELVYRESMMDKYYLPYYKFYAEIDDGMDFDDENLKSYATYYVPAINSAYLTGFPVYKSGFNGSNDYETKHD